jgi:hypothetical protein
VPDDFDAGALPGAGSRNDYLAVRLEGLVGVRYFNATGGMGLNVRWSGPQTPKAVIPSATLKHES